MRVLHVLDHSLPVADGYAVRSHAILLEQQRRWAISALTSPKQERVTAARETIDGIEYRRTPSSRAAWTRLPAANQLADILQVRRALRARIAEERPDIVHAHSPCLNAFAAFGLGVPVVYEMRSSWEDAAVSSGATTEGSPRYRVSRMLETNALKRADAITTICEGLRRDVISRGVAAERVVVAANAVDARKLQEQLPDASAAKSRLGVQGRFVLGFIGSYFAWEGLDLLLEAVQPIRARRSDVLVLLVGHGPEHERLAALVAKLGLESYVRLHGPVPHAAVNDWYAAIDAMVFPRKPMRLTEMVTPIKPLEAMALGRFVIASDVGGHRELIEHGKTGVLFRAGSAAQLADAVVNAAASPADVAAMVRAAKAYVADERTWSRIADVYGPVYESLLARRHVAAGLRS
jgi:glycogen synthase